MTGFVRVAAVAVLLVCPLTGFANGWRSGSRGITAYYYPAPVLYVPVFHVIPVVPCPPATNLGRSAAGSSSWLLGFSSPGIPLPNSAPDT